MSREGELRRELVAYGARLYERGLVAGAEGNLSVRVAPNRLLITPAGMSKGELTADDLVLVDEDGHAIDGHGTPSSERAVHLRILRRRADVQAVVHAHPPVATGFAVAGETIPSDVLPEVAVYLGGVALVHFETPGTEALALAFDPHLEGHDAFLMANHGAVTTGHSLRVAYQRMESLEHTARILLTARLLGRVQRLTPAQLSALLGTR